MVLVLAFTVFHFLGSLNQDIEKITFQSNRVTLLTDEVRISTVAILKNQRKILSRKSSPEVVKKILELCGSLTGQLQQLDTFYKDAKVKQHIAKMIGYVDSLKLVLSKASLFHRDTLGLASIGELADKILDAFSDFQDIQYAQANQRDRQIKTIISETKKNMMISLIIGFLGVIILGLVVPGKIALPFKKINDAIRELQDCNFDVSIYYNQDDEIGELAREMNKMIISFKKFEELRENRITVELKKFDVLANMIKKPVLVADADGKLIYMNNQLYSILQVQSDDVLLKNMTDTRIPGTIIETYELAIKRRSKIENAEIVIPRKRLDNEALDEGMEDQVEANGTSETEENGSENGKNGEKKEIEEVFKGYANVIPIRGKESSLDYYLMVMSDEVFV